MKARGQLARVVIAAVLAALTSGFAWPAAAQGNARRTTVHVVSPVTRSALAAQYTVTKTVAGSCGPGIAGSEVVSFGAVYRCAFGHFVVDPCWADPRSQARRSVVCLDSPWQRRAIVITLDTSLRRRTPKPRVDWRFPWGLVLADGTRCEAYQGAHSSVGDRVLDYFCDDRKTQVLRGIDQSAQPWTVDLYVHGKIAPAATVESAWFGFAGPAEDAPSQLPFSGFPMIPPLILAGVLLASGSALVWTGRRAV